MDFLIQRFEQKKEKIAFVFEDETYTYDWLLNKINYFHKYIDKNNLNNTIIFFNSKITPEAIAFFLSTIEKNIIIIPYISNEFTSEIKKLKEISKPNIYIEFDRDVIKLEKLDTSIEFDLYKRVLENNSSGLVLFSSGTTGEKKATLHDFSKLLKKYNKLRKDHSTIAFMFFDHIGGIDTLFYSLSNCSSLLLLIDRSPKNVCKSIEKWKIEVLPTTPSFLNLMILHNFNDKYDLTSLKYITYGTEVMNSNTLSKLNKFLPNTEIIQKFGATEVGTLGSKSENSNSLWMKLGGEGFKIRVVDNKLEIKSESSMIGYLNAPSPFTEDGWYKTGDLVEEKNGFIKIIGRESNIINVGGEKVNPIEIENKLKELDLVEDILVYGEKNELVGNIVVADVKLIDCIDEEDAKSIIRKFSKNELPNFKRPVKIRFVNTTLFSDRYKKIRLK